MSVVEAPSPPVITEMEETFIKAENYIHEHGWCQNIVQDLDGSVCLAGAIAAVTSGFGLNPLWWRPNLCGSTPRDRLRRRATMTLVRLIGEGSIPAWNDARGRTEQDVLDLLRRAREESCRR